MTRREKKRKNNKKEKKKKTYLSFQCFSIIQSTHSLFPWITRRRAQFEYHRSRVINARPWIVVPAYSFVYRSTFPMKMFVQIWRSQRKRLFNQRLPCTRSSINWHSQRKRSCVTSIRPTHVYWSSSIYSFFSHSHIWPKTQALRGLKQSRCIMCLKPK